MTAPGGGPRELQDELTFRPASSVISTVTDQLSPALLVSEQYGRGGGTSMASPLVTGVAGLIMSRYSELSPQQVMAALEASAVDLGDPGKDPVYASGEVDAYSALKMAEAMQTRGELSISKFGLAATPSLVPPPEPYSELLSNDDPTSSEIQFNNLFIRDTEEGQLLGASSQVAIEVTNYGVQSVSAVEVDVFSGPPTAASVPLLSGTIPFIAGDSSATLEGEIALSIPGQKRLYAVVDRSNSIDEASETLSGQPGFDLMSSPTFTNTESFELTQTDFGLKQRAVLDRPEAQSSPRTDGKSIVWEENGEIFIVQDLGADKLPGTSDDGPVVQLTSNAFSEQQPDVSGPTVVYTSERDGLPAAYCYSAGPDLIYGTADDSEHRLALSASWSNARSYTHARVWNYVAVVQSVTNTDMSNVEIYQFGADGLCGTFDDPDGKIVGMGIHPEVNDGRIVYVETNSSVPFGEDRLVYIYQGDDGKFSNPPAIFGDDIRTRIDDIYVLSGDRTESPVVDGNRIALGR